MENLPPDYFVTSMQFTPKAYTDVYPAIDPTQPALSQEGKIIIITGASRGLGSKTFAESFAAARPKAIILLARNASNLASVASTIQKISPSTETLTLSVDISSESSVAAAFSTIASKFPDNPPSVLINNAGVYPPDGPIHSQSPSEWWSAFEVNGLGTFLVTKHFLSIQAPETLSSTAPTGVTIITLTTGAALLTFPNSSGYGLSKLLSLKIAEYVAAEHPGVTSVAMHPGISMTDMTQPQ
ncbi:MAG: hypothetical protein Q9227_005076 [Pyrenula ochraceoflavens]